jgi:hypothetical protein
VDVGDCDAEVAIKISPYMAERPSPAGNARSDDRSLGPWWRGGLLCRCFIAAKKDALTGASLMRTYNELSHREALRMRTFGEARVEDLGPADRVKVECLGRMPNGERCNRVTLLDVHSLRRHREPLPPRTPIKDLYHWLRCENCDERGHLDLRIIWGEIQGP